MRLSDWFSGQTSRLPVLAQDLRHLDPWVPVHEALERFELVQLETGLAFEPPLVHRFTKPKKGGKGVRTLHNPNASLRVIQRALEPFVNTVIKSHLERDRWVDVACKKRLESFMTLPSAYAFKKGSSTATTVLVHAKQRGRRSTAIDLQGAYDNVNLELLTTILTSILLADRSSALTRFSPKQSALHLYVHDLFSDTEMLLWQRMFSLLRKFFALDTLAGVGILQGSSASPWLFNIMCEALVNLPIKILLHQTGEQNGGRAVVMTQYADNLDFTSRNWGDVPMAEIRRLINNVFQINHGKVHHVNLDRSQAHILGYSLGPNGRVIFPKRKRERLHVAIEIAIRDLQKRKPGWKISYGRAMGYWGEFVTYLAMLEELHQPKTRSDLNTLDRQDVLTGWKPQRRRRKA